MSQAIEPSSESQRLEVQSYITILESYEKRYANSAFWHRLGATIMQVGALLATAATTVLAGVYQVGGWPGFFLVALPATATFLLSVRSGLRLSDVWRVREEAAIEFRGLVSRARQRLVSANTEEECGRLYRDLEGWARRLERQAMISAVGSIEESDTNSSQARRMLPSGPTTP